MKFGEDDYGRYIDLDTAKYTVEPFPYKRYFWLVAWKRFEIWCWWVSKQTGIGWDDES